MLGLASKVSLWVYCVDDHKMLTDHDVLILFTMIDSSDCSVCYILCQTKVVQWAVCNEATHVILVGRSRLEHL